MIYRIPFCQETVILEEILACMKRVKRIGASDCLSKELAKKIGKKQKLSGNVTDFVSEV